VSASRAEARRRRHRRVRKKISGTPQRPRLAVFRSNKHVYVQAIDDVHGHTVAAASTVERELRDADGKPVEVAKRVGALVAERLRSAGIETAVFDRGGFRYHGRVAAVADGAREAGLDV
jgi:large subunit ribosomal protein L18